MITDTRRVVKALILAIVVAMVGTYLIYRRARLATPRTTMTQVVGAAHELSAGATLTSKDVRLVEWPANVTLPGSFGKLDEVLGHPLVYPVGAGEPLLARDLAPEGSGAGLSAKIPAGMRATSVRSNEIVGVAGFLFPGSRVDVLSTITLPGNPSPITQTILQDVEVLTAGTQIQPDPQGKPQSVNVVTVLLTPADSQKLLLASTQGTIQFVLRNGTDKGQVAVEPTRLSQLASGETPESKPAAAAHTAKPAAPAPAVKSSESAYQLEIIRGNNVSVQKF